MSAVEEMLELLRDPQHVGRQLLEMRARWHRAKDEYDRIKGRSTTDWTTGRMAGYEQCIGLLLGRSATEVHNELMAEHIAAVAHRT